jgi:hypothetical protein
MKPRWKIDDTSEPARTFCEHTRHPRFQGELLPLSKVRKDTDAFPAPNHCCVAVSRWLDDPDEGFVYEEHDMYDSLAAALQEHAAAKRPLAAN